MAEPLTTIRPSPWHAGEIALQKAVGVSERMDIVGRQVIRDHLIEQHRAFYPQLPFAVFGSVDAQGDAWASVKEGHPGFLSSLDSGHLSVALRPDGADPADDGLRTGEPVGMLGIEMHTRRRNRLNGTVGERGANGFVVSIDQSYGNCPQYIQLRDFRFAREPSVGGGESPEWHDRLTSEMTAIVTLADTFFVATYADIDGGRRTVDVSHRGGKAGFVRVSPEGVLTIPDFAGNLFFNTLGNILSNGKAGLIFVDFENGNLLQMTGNADVILDSPEIAAFQGAERLWRFTPRKIVLRRSALAIRWNSRADGASPNSLLTGTWDDAAKRLKAASLAGVWRPFRVSQIVEESATIRSFHLEPTDGNGLQSYSAGQHLPIRLTPGDTKASVIRTYTLSSAPSDGFYRISVKRDGVASRHLHDSVKEGDIIEARAPAGGFTIDAAQTRPAVLLAAGVGITPILSMARQIVYEGLRTRHFRPTWLFYGARTKKERAFDRELESLVDAAKGEVKLVRVVSETNEAGPEDFDHSGRIDIKILKETLPFGDYDFYLCGPAPFMQSTYDGLRSLNVADDRIHAEAFGPASMIRTSSEASPQFDLGQPAASPVGVKFEKSMKQALWNPASGTLLELAETAGLSPEFSCRVGSCGSCKSRLKSGAVAYTRQPTAPMAEGEVILCCAVPGQGTAKESYIVLDL